MRARARFQWTDLDPTRNVIELQWTAGVRGGRLIVNTPTSGRLRMVGVPVALLALQERTVTPSLVPDGTLAAPDGVTASEVGLLSTRRHWCPRREVRVCTP
jgi:hypothetical protein